jgi:hypothetical protein
MAERKRGRTCEERARATRISQRILALSQIARWKRPCVVPCDVISVRPLGLRLARSQTPAANPWWQDWVGEPLTLRASAAERRSVSPARPLLSIVKAASARGGPRGERLAFSPAAKAGAADMIRQSALSGSITLRWEPGPANLPAAPCGAGWLFAGSPPPVVPAPTLRTRKFARGTVDRRSLHGRPLLSPGTT